MGVVYQAKNRVNGKRYVGKTMGTMKVRRKAHEKEAKNDSRILFYNALRKHGPCAFEWKVLMRSDDSDDLNDLEMGCIKMLKTKAPNGYNLTDGGTGGDTFSGRHHTPESIVKMRESRTEEIIARVAAFHRGRKRPPETGLRISKATKGKRAWNKGVPSGATTVPDGCTFEGRNHTEESKIKMSEAKSGSHHTAETKAKISRSKKGKKTGKPAWSKGLTKYTNESLWKMSETKRRSAMKKKQSSSVIGG